MQLHVPRLAGAHAPDFTHVLALIPPPPPRAERLLCSVGGWFSAAVRGHGEPSHPSHAGRAPCETVEPGAGACFIEQAGTCFMQWCEYLRARAHCMHLLACLFLCLLICRDRVFHRWFSRVCTSRGFGSGCCGAAARRSTNFKPYAALCRESRGVLGRILQWSPGLACIVGQGLPRYDLKRGACGVLHRGVRLSADCIKELQ